MWVRRAICKCHLLASSPVRSARPWRAQGLRASRTPTARRWQVSACALATAVPLEAPEAAAGTSAEHPLVLYNTLTRRKEAFRPREGQGNKVSMYCCGVTVYDLSHIGHARVYCCFDVLLRLLRHLGYEVTYVRNFTDVDDKIIKRAAERNEDPQRLAERFIDEFHADMAALNCLAPAAEPRATAYIPQMVAAIGRIVAAGHGYAAGGDVYLAVDSVPGYGRLSGRRPEDNEAGRRVAVAGAKRGPADFVLWKAAKPGEPRWDSPWGPGRPGWHIECSAMARELLGPIVDIHGGGRDLVFPHHENELAQSQAAACECDRVAMPGGRDFVRWWSHVGFVNGASSWTFARAATGSAVDSEKMSKSLGNFFTIREVAARYHPLALRLFLMSAFYRTGLAFSQQGLEEASASLYYIYQTLADMDEALVKAPEPTHTPSGGEGPKKPAAGGGGASSPGAKLAAGVRGALCDDLNTPGALGVLWSPLAEANRLVGTAKGRKVPGRVETLRGIRDAAELALELLGLRDGELTTGLAQMRALALARAGLSEGDVAAAIAQRAAARASKDFAAGDAVREELLRAGITLMDAPSGTTWRPAAHPIPTPAPQ